ncbi:SlyX family protein [Methylomarinum sp. Ch1-1]|uniref:Protein SlyX homolog n=1 Tax=Methylomarinum roseum TaxID=3067653 RepID=A0AAU7NSR8_9GAMM|nr:SlyX family protein [Methylomarinum sp. Ch1-1]MDP4519988.1 SlyX family protein [Methylomarinum sp. Ch1-1]
MSEERIIELEIKAAYQEELLESLNSIVAQQQQQIDKLEETCKLLHDKIESLSPTEAGKALQDEIPPHY